jgi:hypothetical protein
MKKAMTILILFFIFFTVGGTSVLFGQEGANAHVAVLRFANETSSTSYDAACKAATDTLVLTLQQLGRYRLQSEEASGSGEEALRAMAEEKHLDFIMYGKMSTGESGGIDCRLSVFDRAKGTTTLSQTRKAAGVLDIFDTADELVVSVLESMTGSHIGFGSLTLGNTGEKGSYRVLVDGYSVGADVASLERVLNGRHTVTVLQRRMLGDREIARSSVEIKEGETAEIQFAVPYLMDDEKAKVEGLKAAIGADWNVAKAMGDVDAKMAEFASLFGDVSYSPKLSSYKDEAKQLGAEWTLRKGRAAIEGSAWDPKVELLDAGGALYGAAKGYPDPAKIRKAFEESAQLVATLFELKAGKSLGEGDIDSGLECFGNALMLSTRYLGGKRMTDYAYAVTTLKDFQEKTGSAGASDKDMQTAFGALIQAGRRFYGLQNQVMAGTACALVASDFATRLSVDGGEYADAPLALQPVQGSRAVSVQSDGAGKAITLTAVDGEKLLFVQDGFASFGKITLGYIPGSIQVEVNQEGAKVALDDEDPVNIPHLFENVVPGVHTLSIHDLAVRGKVYAGTEEKVSVEAGKRVKFHRDMKIGSAKLRVEGIPDGSTIQVEGEERPLVANPAGGMVFEGVIDAGLSKIEVVHGNKTWNANVFLSSNGTRTLNVATMSLRLSLQRYSVQLKGKESDWEGIEAIFSGSGYTKTPKIPGSQIAGGSICRDNKNLYFKMDFTNGWPLLAQGSIRQLELRQGSPHFQHVNLQLFVWTDGIHSEMWVEKENRSYQRGSFVVGSSFVEFKFQLSWLSEYFDFSEPIQAKLQFFVYPNYALTANATGAVEILIGK